MLVSKNISKKLKRTDRTRPAVKVAAFTPLLPTPLPERNACLCSVHKVINPARHFCSKVNAPKSEKQRSRPSWNLFVKPPIISQATNLHTTP